MTGSSDLTGDPAGSDSADPAQTTEPAADPDAPSRMANIQVGLQRFGGYLAGMVMPNIGAFIAWGLIATLFEPDGWIPNATVAHLVNPTIDYLLPVLIGYTGGRLVHGQRGAVVASIATIGIAVGASVPMFLGAMLVGPFTAYLLKIFDRHVRPRVHAGFTMLVDNFSIGILGGTFAVLGMLAIGPVLQWLTWWLGNGVQYLVTMRLLPLASIIIEPAKVLFLNNAVNHGILGPIGAEQTMAHGKAIEFLMETNPGPGLGILLAFLLFGPRSLRPSVPGAIIIHFLGGIHEIYFPYVLAKPRMVLAMIAGGAMGVLTFVITGAGTISTPSPGSIIAVLAVTPKDSLVGVLSGVFIAAGTTFLVGSALFGFGHPERARARAEALARPEVPAATRTGKMAGGLPT
jgi:PTS system mannitol-specific IIC component